jgi:hypothetical protein
MRWLLERSIFRAQDPALENFLRLRIDEQGDLMIFTVGIERVPQKWAKVMNGPTSAIFIPKDQEATLPELIEPVPVPKTRSHEKP